MKAWRSSLGRGRARYYPVIKGLKRGDKVAAAGGFLIDAETRLNPAAAATYFGASGGPQSSGRPDVQSAPSPATERSGPGRSSRNRTIPARQAGAQGDGRRARRRRPQEHRATARGRPATGDQRSGFALSPGVALGSMGVPVKITLRGQTVFLCCKGCMGKAKRNPDEMLKKLAEARRGQARRLNDPSN